MKYHYKKLGDWTWKSLETGSLEAELAAGRISREWRFRIDGEAQDFTLDELVAASKHPKPSLSSVPRETYPAVRTLARMYRALAYIVLCIGILLCIFGGLQTNNLLA